MSVVHAEIRRAQSADREAVVSVLTEAFQNDPLTCWLFPDPSERSGYQRRFYRHQLKHAGAEAYLVGDGDGASLWHALPTGNAAPPPHEPDLEAAFGANAERMGALGRVLAPHHPEGEAHLHLFCMGVLGDQQGAGLGSAMLRDRLERADSDGIAAHLEASSPRSRALYLRHGFEDLGQPVHLPDGPLLWPMRRAPRW